MKKNQLICYILFFAGLLGLANLSFAEEAEKKYARLNAGYYFKSINQLANRTDIEISLNYWGKEIFDEESKKHNFGITSSKSILFDSMEDMHKAFDQGELDMIVAPPFLITRYFKREELQDGFLGVLEGHKQETLMLIVRNDKNIDDIKDLHGKRLEMMESDEFAEMYLDTLTLKSLHKSYKNMGLSIQYNKKINLIILDIFFDKADAAMVYRSAFDIMAELNPAIRDKIKILKEYPLKGKNFSFFRRGYPLAEDFTNSMVEFPKNPRGKQILEVFHTVDIDHCSLNDLDSFEQFDKEYNQLKKHGHK